MTKALSDWYGMEEAPPVHLGEYEVKVAPLIPIEPPVVRFARFALLFGQLAFWDEFHGADGRRHYTRLNVTEWRGIVPRERHAVLQVIPRQRTQLRLL